MAFKSAKEDLDLLSQEIYLDEPKKEGDIWVSLGYPNLYKLGMANLGFQAVYRIFNSLPGVACHRFFLPKPSRQEELRRSGKHLTVFESGRLIKEFDIVAFSLSYEMDYFNVIKILSLAGIPFFSEDRDESWPLVVFGGACTFINPEPLASIADVIVIGEAEELIPQFITFVKEKKDKTQLLKNLSQNSGFYIPSLYKFHYMDDGTIANIEGLEGAPFPVERVWLRELTKENISYSSIITSKAAFGKVFLVELCRGCTSGCKFCWAGFNYLPRRCIQPEAIVKIAKAARDYTDRIGLIATSVGDYPGLKDMLEELIHMEYEVTLSSLRIEHINEELLSLLVKGGLRSIAIAPETGSDILRFSINKKITNEEILEKTQQIFQSGIRKLKLYYLIGLPNETDEDVREIVDLSEEINEKMIQVGKPRGKIGGLSLSVNCFIPKPLTPYQRYPLEDNKSLRLKVDFLRKALSNLGNVEANLMPPWQAQRQAFLSRGDRKIAKLLIYMEQHDCDWNEAVHRCGADISFYTHRNIPQREIVPWNIISKDK